MTDNELEKQAKLWHVESTLEPKKAAKLEERLQSALPKARTRRRWKQAGAALALTCLPVGGITALVFSTNPKAQIESLEEVPGQTQASFGSFYGLLATDGRVVEGNLYNAGGVERGIYVWKPSSSRPEEIQLPKALFTTQARLGSVQTLLPDGGLLGTAVNRSYDPLGPFLFQRGQWSVLAPLPGYTSARAERMDPRGVVGRSVKYIFYQDARLGKSRKEETKPTLWRKGKPEPLPELPDAYMFSSSNVEGNVLVTELSNPPGKKVKLASGRNQLFVLSGDQKIPISLEERDAQGRVLATAKPERLGSRGMILGTIDRGGVNWGALWTSPTAMPHPLWEPSFSFSPVCLTCEDADAEGKVVGNMQNPVTEAVTPYIWKDGRYFELQKLLPRSSGWELTSVGRVAGRFVLGNGLYRGAHATYRLTLPPGVP